MYAVAAGILFAAGMAAYMINSFWFAGDHFPPATAAPYQPPPSFYPDNIDDSGSESVEQYQAKYIPRITDLPHTAPVFDKLTQVKTFPRPQCLYRWRNNVCKCYTQQATPLDVSHDMCMHIVKNGWFNPFKEESSEPAESERGTRPLAGDPVPSEPLTPRQPIVLHDRSFDTARLSRLSGVTLSTIKDDQSRL
jgi:hypothetical protein